MSIEAMKQAHQAFEAILGTLTLANEQGLITDTIWFSEHETLFDCITYEADTLRTAIEQMEKQEPVAWGNFKEDGTLVGLSQHPEDQANWVGRKPLYTTPPHVATPLAASVQESTKEQKVEAALLAIKAANLAADELIRLLEVLLPAAQRPVGCAQEVSGVTASVSAAAASVPQASNSALSAAYSATAAATSAINALGCFDAAESGDQA